MGHIFIKVQGGKSRISVSSESTAKVLKSLQSLGSFHYSSPMSKSPRFDMNGNWHKGISILPLIIGGHARQPVGESGLRTSVRVARKNDLSYDSISVGPWFFKYVRNYINDDSLVENKGFFFKLMGSARMCTINKVLDNLIEEDKYITLQDFINHVGVKFFTAYRNHHLMYEVLGDDRVYEKMRYGMDSLDRNALRSTILSQKEYSMYVA